MRKNIMNQKNKIELSCFQKLVQDQQKKQQFKVASHSPISVNADLGQKTFVHTTFTFWQK